MEGNQRSYSLDFLKILATTAIIFHHFQQVTGAKYENSLNFCGGWFYWGYLVELFFILSGYFMYKYVTRIREGGVTLLAWWVQRAKRLLPMMAASVIGYELILLAHLKLLGVAYREKTLTVWGTVIASLGIQAGWGFRDPMVNTPIWYISVLMLCYIWFYVLSALADKLKCSEIYFYIAMIFLGVGIHTYDIKLPFLNSYTYRGYYSFFLGLLLAYFVDRFQITRKIFSMALLCVGFFAFAYIRYPSYLKENQGYLLNFLLWPSMILVLEADPIRRFFKHKVWGALSKISFEVYLWHNPMLILMYLILGLLGWTTDFSSVYSMYLFCVLMWIVGAVMYFLVEQPMQKYIDRWLAGIN